MNAISKIKLGKSKRDRVKLDLTHDVNTTAGFGEVQPLMCREMIPGSTMDVKVESFVRLAPMPVPTFGRIKYKTYHQFVPIADIYRKFENMLSGTSFGGVIPTDVPRIRMSNLVSALIDRSWVSFYKGSTSVGAADVLVQTNSVSPLVVNSTDFNTASGLFNSAYAYRTVAGSYQGPLSTWTDTLLLGRQISLSEADLVLTFSPDDPVVASKTVYFAAVKFKDTARLLRKIFIGCGYQINPTSPAVVSFLPLIAYYKAYFDIFYPQQLLNWDNTYAFRLMEVADNIATTDVVTSQYWANFQGFINELQACYYYGDPDYLSAHLGTPSLNTASVKLPANSATSLAMSDTNTPVAGVNAQPTLSVSQINQGQLNLLQKLYYWVNKNTVIGQRIADYLRVHYGADFIQETKSNYIGADSIDCQISDVMSTSDTALGSGADATGANIGEYAGKGIGYGDGDKVKFTADTFGYWVTLATIVPDITRSQGVDPHLFHRSRFEFYNPEFDGLGFTITTKDVAVGTSDTGVMKNVTTTGSGTNAFTEPGTVSFGYIPRLSEYKVAQNVLNGDLTRRGTKQTLLPYTLDSLATINDVRFDDVSTGGGYTGVRVNNSAKNVPLASYLWRQIGGLAWLQNFNRIFYQNDTENVYGAGNTLLLPIDDNFIIHNILSVDCYAPVKSLSESFETEGESKDVMAVEKA